MTRPIFKADVRTERWGATTMALFANLRKIWREHYIKPVGRITNAFDFNPNTGRYNVDEEAIRKNMAQIRNKSAMVWNASAPYVKKAFGNATKKGLKHFTDQQAKTKSVFVSKLNQADWDRLVETSLTNHMELFTREFPDRILGPEVERLVNLFVSRAETDIAAIATVQERIRRLDQMLSGYLYDLTDVTVGRAWNFAGINMAYDTGVVRAMIVAILDALTCQVCVRLHGKRIDVAAMYNRANAFLNADYANATDVASGWPFPRIADVDNVSPRIIEARGYLPMFHNKCRCDIVFLW